MVEGPSGILEIHPPDFRPLYEPSKRRLVWPNGVVATTYNAVEPDQLRGPQHGLAWCDELAKYRYPTETWDNLQFGLRVGKRPQVVVSTTPRPIKIIRDIIEDPDTVTTRGSTYDNRANLADTFIRRIVRKYEGTRIGRQELLAELLDDIAGALWTREMFERARLRIAPMLKRIVVSVDPSGTEGEDLDDGDDIGIVVAGIAENGHYVVLEDLTGQMSPAKWAQTACFAFMRWGADRIVAERNFGGAMVRHTIQSFDSTVPVKLVTASRSKHVRAEPVAALYEQNRVRHVGSFPEMEDELVMFTRDGYGGESSPNRGDALVWAITELMSGAGDDVVGLPIQAR